MRKVWVTKRKGIPGQYVEWYDNSGRRRSKYFQPEFKKYIKPFQTRKFAELNSDVRPIGSVVDVTWSAYKAMYLKDKKAEGIAEKTRRGVETALSYFEEACQPVSTKLIFQDTITKFKLYLREKEITYRTNVKVKNPDTGKLVTKTVTNTKPLTENSINKYLRDIKSVLYWGKAKGYIDNSIIINKVQSTAKIAKILSDKEVKELLLACADDAQWKMRILIALCTGLRRSDIDKLKINDINIELKTITTRNQKTGKITNYQPLPDAMMPYIHTFLAEEVDEGQARLFKTKWTKKWYTITKRAGLEDLDFHDLRKTFGSMQADAGVPIKALQEMYNHANIETTMKHYIRTDESEKRSGVNKLKVQDWL